MNKRKEREAVERSLELVDRQAEEVEARHNLEAIEPATKIEDKRVA
jgi:hypothetical protein